MGRDSKTGLVQYFSHRRHKLSRAAPAASPLFRLLNHAPKRELAPSQPLTATTKTHSGEVPAPKMRRKSLGRKRKPIRVFILYGWADGP